MCNHFFPPRDFTSVWIYIDLVVQNLIVLDGLLQQHCFQEDQMLILFKNTPKNKLLKKKKKENSPEE